MRFTSLLSAFLATLVVSNPIPNPEAASLRLLTRADPVYKDSPEYTVAIKAKPGLKKDTYHYFTLEWPLGTVPAANKETRAELEKIRAKLGYDHIGVVVGQITEKSTTTKGKNPVTTIERNFNAVLWDLIKDDKAKVKERFKNWLNKGEDAQKLVYGGVTSATKIGKVKKGAKDYTDANPDYKDTVNCGTFKDAIVAIVK
ncbi:hypothetical protein B0H67DRAFT_551701 [Lasiosphaeris hirsuta]|uniref:Uncharacterized protein n=1 Tax=Lasiosphaeris hirsuta TaxID=260670 RepID=A0AA40DXK6_9PEZI|nr:hypothetical protein B0H67DRAFT_551701 [Lasiosphaeris hirsuta]